MADLSRSLHRNQVSSATLSKKLSNLHNFTGKTVYDDVFAGPRKFGAPTFSSRVEDYCEIFGNSHASRSSSIPVLDLPTVNERQVSIDVRSSKFDYSKVFGGFGDVDFAVSYEELIAEPKGQGHESSSEEAWTPAESGSPSEGSDVFNCLEENQVLSDEASYQSFDGLKQFNMSYHKTGQRSKDGTSGTARTAQLNAVPGFTCLIDEITPLQKSEGDKPAPSIINDVSLNMDFSEGIVEGKHCRKSMSHLPTCGAKKQTSEGVEKFQSGSDWNGSCSNDTLFNAYEINLRTHPSKVPPPNLVNNKGVSKRSMASNFEGPKNDASEGAAGDCSPPSSDEEVDANSDAAASAAALRKAIKIAQERIRIAKESMERKREGLQSSVKLSFKGGLKVKERAEGKIDVEANRFREEKAQEICERVDPALHGFAGMEGQNAKERSEVAPNFTGGGKLNIAKESIGEKHVKESVERKKEGLQSSVRLNFKDGLKVKERTEGKIDVEANRFKEKKAQEICERVDPALHGFDGMEGQNANERSEVAPSFTGGEKIYIDKESVGEKHAKESVERKKEGLQSSVKLSFKDELKVKERTEGKIDVEANGFKEKKAQEICERVDTALHVFSGMEGQNAKERSEVAPSFTGGEKLYIDKESVGEKHANESKSTQVDHRQEGAGEWEVAKHFYELLNTGKQRAAAFLFKQAADSEKKMLQSTHEYECKGKNTAKETFEQPEEHGKTWTAVEEAAHEPEEIERKLKAVKGARGWEEHANKLKSAQEVHHQQEEHEEKLRVAGEQKETEEKLKASHEQKKIEKKLEESQEPIENENKLEAQEWKENDNEKRLKEAQEQVENEKKQQEAHKQVENGKRLKKICEQEENEVKLKKICEQEKNEKRLKEACELVEYEKKLKEACVQEENEKKQKDAYEGEDNEKRLDKVHGLEINEKRLNEADDGEESERRLKEDCEGEQHEKLKEARKQEENKKILEEAYQMEENEKRLTEAYEWEETERMQGETDLREENEKIKATQEFLKHEKNLKAANDACKQDDCENLSGTQESCRHEENDKNVEVTQEVLAHEENGRIVEVAKASSEPKENERESKAVKGANELEEKEMFETAGLVQGAYEHNEIENKMKDATEALLFDYNGADFGGTQMNFGRKQVDQSKKESKIAFHQGQHVEKLTHDSGENKKNVKEAEVACDQEEDEHNFEAVHGERPWVENGKNLEASQLSSAFEGKGKTMEIAQEINISQNAEKNEKNLNETFTMEEKESKETIQKEVELEKEHLRKVDEANERKRKQEKDRIAVERAIREARERAFAEARERAERAAVERATAEARERVMAEARERLEKATVEAKSLADKASMEAKLRAERAAVERATAEARERALEKALSEKSAFAAREQAESFVAEKFSGASRDDGMRHSFSSPNPQYQGSGPSSSSRYSSLSNHGVHYASEKFEEAKGESAQRCKARLERHQRTVERASKALAEKNMRDLLAQKEQAERNRLAEALDADVKRWSSGKQGNLRALLSTLQYILGPDSGWQPISLTDIVTINAVKKAYRKATLCVHPDKLQQRGASIQQKYICEKVFDLLKEAWNKFNSEER